MNTSKKIGIIDIGSGNLKSVEKALHFLKFPAETTKIPETLEDYKGLILPGVGNFQEVANEIKSRKMDQSIKEALQNKKPFLGICVGLQILFESSEESLEIRGLSIFKGKVVKFQQGKVPQIGWNYVTSKNPKDSLFQAWYAYFVNSFYAIPEDPLIITSNSN